MSLVLSTLIESESWLKMPEIEDFASAVMDQVVLTSGIRLRPEAEVSLLLCDDTRIREINREWRNIDKPTNVLSFPAVPREALEKTPLLGDIAIAYETVVREAQDEHKTLRDHFAHMVCHGFLHLLGFDHETDEEANTMEAIEIRVLADLGIADPYASLEPDKSSS